jgi:hypothetical protein
VHTGTEGVIEFRKIGEASYSEVFGIGDVVLKVIPLRDEDADASQISLDGGVEDGPSPSDAKDVLKEMIVTRAMGEMCEGFVDLLRTYVVRGKYPELLLTLWDEYAERKGSESIRPGNVYAQNLLILSLFVFRYLQRIADVRHHRIAKWWTRFRSIYVPHCW